MDHPDWKTYIPDARTLVDVPRPQGLIIRDLGHFCDDQGTDACLREDRNVVGKAIEWGSAKWFGLHRHARWMLERENWRTYDGGVDYELDACRVDAKGVTVRDNPCLMVREYPRGMHHYRCNLFVCGWVKLDGDLPLQVGVVGWMAKVNVTKDPVRDSFCGKKLERPARCIHWWRLTPSIGGAVGWSGVTS